MFLVSSGKDRERLLQLEPAVQMWQRGEGEALEQRSQGAIYRNRQTDGFRSARGTSGVFQDYKPEESGSISGSGEVKKWL